MSGIVGCVHFDGRSCDDALLVAMRDALAHRGPDGSRLVVDGPAGFGHLLLRTTHECDYESQPIVSRGGDLVLVADARLYNRDHLIDVMKPGVPAAELSDSALVLLAFEKWGTGCPSRLVGDFAFAVWDRRERRLFGARDHFGIRPLYYAHSRGETFTFGTEVSAVLCSPDVSHEIDDIRVADYISSFTLDKERTFYRDVRQIPAATSFLVTTDGMQSWLYWQPDTEFEAEARNPEAHAEAFREVLDEAVRSRIRARDPVGASLSGGLDSSTVVCLASRHLRNQSRPPVRTYSAIFERFKECDEREYVDEVLSWSGAENCRIVLDRHNPMDGALQSISRHGHPPMIRNEYLWQLKYGAAAEEGVRVMLDGEDGDTVVSHGESYLYFLAAQGAWKEFGRLSDALMRHFAMYDPSPRYLVEQYAFPALDDRRKRGEWSALLSGIGGLSRHAGYDVRRAVRAQLARPFALAIRRRLGRGGNSDPVKQIKSQFPSSVLLSRERADELRYFERLLDYSRAEGAAETFRQGHAQGLTAASMWAYEEQDRNSASHQIEARHPFHDLRVVEASLALPPELRLHDGWPRWILRQAMEGILPPKIQWRVGKSNLGASFQFGFFDQNEEFLRETVFGCRKLDRFYEMDRLEKAFDLRAANYAWPAVMLGLWLCEIEDG